MKKKIGFLICMGFVLSCSTKKDTFTSRAYHNSTAWFNTLFNAEEALEKKLDELEFSYKDNYSEVLHVDPRPEVKEAEILDDPDEMAAGFKPGKGSSGVEAATGFDLVEKKATKAIENHSMVIKGKEKNKTMTRAYLILGKAKYNKGLGFEALEAFNYLENRLPYSKKYTPEAKLYSALASEQIGNDDEAEKILVNMYKDGGYKRKMTENISKYYAEYLIEHNELEEALVVLDNAIAKSKNKKRKARYYFIEAQLYSQLGDQDMAGQAYTKVFKMKPGFEMEVKSQLGIAANFDPEKNSYNSYKEHLLDISEKGNYHSRRNELYYAIGDIAIKADKKDDAKKYLQESFKGEPTDPYIRGRAYERYADLHLAEGNYVYALAYFDSALAVAPYQKDIDRLTITSTSLTNLMKKYYLVKKNDSILKVAHMSPEEQNKFFGDFISKLKIEDEKKKKQIEEETTNFQTLSRGRRDFGSFGGDGRSGGGGTFYFYNTNANAQGKNDFKRIWGNIRLGDNWRNSASGSVSLEDKEAEMLGQADTRNPRRYELEYYLEQIPTAERELQNLKIERDTAELSLGIGYFELFNNAKTATATLEHLISTPPKEAATEAQAYYQLYRINKKVDNLAKAEEFKTALLSKHPNSIYAEYILNPEVDFITPTTKEALAFYEETYELYKQDKFDEVKKRTLTALEQYPTEIIIAKFALLNAMAIGKTEGKDNFKSALELITVAYQNTPEADKAQEILDLLNGVKREKKNPAAKSGDQKQKEEEKQQAEQRKEQSVPAGRNMGDGNQQQQQQRQTEEKRKQDEGQRRGPGKPGQ